MRIYAGGYLSFYTQRKKTSLELTLPAPTRLKTILAQLNIPFEEVHLVAINGDVSEEDDPMVDDRDEVRVFSRVNGG
jgi:sulfur carrier protein ThiS